MATDDDDADDHDDAGEADADDDDDHFACRMLPRGARVTCYPRARVSHATLEDCIAFLARKQSKAKQSKSQSKAKILRI